MECCSGDNNQSINGSFSNKPDAEEVSVFIIYLFMITALISAIVVITPAVTIINVIWQIRELHTKYFFFISYLL